MKGKRLVHERVSQYAKPLPDVTLNQLMAVSAKISQLDIGRRLQNEEKYRNVLLSASFLEWLKSLLSENAKGNEEAEEPRQAVENLHTGRKVPP